jgi:hypothetical protein
MNPELPPLISSKPPLIPSTPPGSLAPALDLRSISGVQGMSVADLQQAVAAGGKFVRFQFCVSVLVLSFKRSSPIIFVRPGESAFAKGLSYSLISLVAGWWGIPWGPIWTLTTVAENIAGGKDLTPFVLAALGSPLPSVNKPPAAMSPTEVAEHAERESRKTLVQRLAFVVLAILILFGIYAVYKISEAGSAASHQPGAAELRRATSLISSGGASGSGNGAKATQLAADMSKLMKAHREENFGHAAKKSFMDERDEFRTYCDLREGQCVFLIHVPELRRFKVEAKQSLADSAWFFAQGLLGKGGERMRLAVALRGISAYDRVLTGEYTPGKTERLTVKPEVYDGFSCEKQLIPWFAPEPADLNQPDQLNGQTNVEQAPANAR